MPLVNSVTPPRWRSFIAASPPESLRVQLRARCRQLQKQPAAERLRWLPEAQWHLTLRFLGDQPPERLWQLAAALQSPLATAAPATLALQTPDWFPNAHRPAVLACRSDRPPALRRLLETLDTALAACDIDTERRRFQGHISLARPRRGKPPERVLAEKPETLRFELNEIALFRSELRPEGAHHSVLARFPLS